MTPTCINLRERFGGRYRIGFDEAAEDTNDPRTMTIPCRSGTIYSHGGEMLAVELNGRPKITKKVAAIHDYKGSAEGQPLLFYRLQAGAKEGFPKRQAPESTKGDQEVA